MTHREDLVQALDAVPLADATPEAWGRWRERMMDLYRCAPAMDDGDVIRAPLGWYVVVPVRLDRAVVTTSMGPTLRETRVRAGLPWIENEDGAMVWMPGALLDEAAEKAMKEVEA